MTAGNASDNTAERSPVAASTTAQKWARWSLMWGRVAPVVDAESWFYTLDAHRKAYSKEAVTEACLTLLPDYPGLLTPEFYTRRFARRYMPRAEFNTWVDRLMRCVEKVQVNSK